MKRKYISKKIRRKVFERDNYTCVYCGARSYEEPLEIDHVIPISKGGSNNINNLVTSCRMCNRVKHTNMPTRSDAEKLTKILGVTVSDLIGETSEVASSQKEELSFADMLSRTEYMPTSLSYGYWGDVADNARDVAVSGDKDAIAYVSQMLKRALSLLTTDVKEVTNPDNGNSYVTNMPVMVGKRNENTVTLATA